MNDAAILERRYRRLLRWYPRWFRDEIEDEALGVLMASARDGQRWPSAAEAADVTWSALRMRFRLPPPGSQSRGWSDAWAVFSVLAPVFLLVANIVVVMVPPYFLPVRPREFDGTILFMRPNHNWLQWAGDARGFYLVLLFQAAVVVTVLAGWRWVALAVTLGSACCMLTGPRMGHYPFPLAWLTVGWCILEPLALLASPGPRRGRTLLTWGHGVVLVLAVGAVKLSSLTWFVIGLGDEVIGNKPLADILLIVAAVFAVAAVTGPVALRQGGRMSLLVAALLYPSLIEFTSFAVRRVFPLLDTSVNPAILLLMPLVMAVLAVLIAARERLASSHARLTPGG